MQTTQVPLPTQERAEQIRSTAAAEYQRISSRGDLTVPAIQVLLARAYVKGKSEMDALRERTSSTSTANSRHFYQAAFGIDDIAGASGVNRASASVSYRDAQDRVASLDSPQAADYLFTRAENSGDELLARAIAQRAYDEGQFLGWGDILDRYLATRPAAQRAVNELLNARSNSMSASNLFAFVFIPPAQLGGLADYQIQALAADDTLV